MTSRSRSSNKSHMRLSMVEFEELYLGNSNGITQKLSTGTAAEFVQSMTPVILYSLSKSKLSYPRSG